MSKYTYGTGLFMAFAWDVYPSLGKQSIYSPTFFACLTNCHRVNPVKMFLHVFPAVSPWQIAVVCGGFMTYIFLSDVKNMLYFGIKIFFHSIISIFFRNVEIIGR